MNVYIHIFIHIYICIVDSNEALNLFCMSLLTRIYVLWYMQVDAKETLGFRGLPLEWKQLLEVIPTLEHTHTPTYTHSHIPTLSHTHTLTYPHSHIHTLSHTHTLTYT